MKRPRFEIDDVLPDLPVMHLVPSTLGPRALARRIAIAFGVLLILVAFLPWQQSISGRGTVSAFAPVERRQNVESPIPGRVEEIHVQEGEHVVEGQPLVTITDNDPHLLDRFAAERQALETRVMAYRSRADLLRERVDSVRASQDASLATARARVQVAEERTRAARQAVAAAQASLDVASTQLRRQESLAAEGLVSQRDLELTQLAQARARTDAASAEAALGAAQGELSAARAGLAQADADAAARIQEAEAGYESAETDFAGAEGAIQRLDTTIARSQNQTIRAPRPGIVYRILIREGSEQISTGEAVLSLVPDEGSRAVELWVDGNDAPLITPGRKVRIQFEGWPAIQFSGWPQVAVGTFGGVVSFVDATDDGDGDFRVVVVPERGGRGWPDRRYLRQGVRAKGWVLLERVSLGYEIWRRFNGFPPALRRGGGSYAASGGSGGYPRGTSGASSGSPSGRANSPGYGGAP